MRMDGNCLLIIRGEGVGPPITLPGVALLLLLRGLTKHFNSRSLPKIAGMENKLMFTVVMVMACTMMTVVNSSINSTMTLESFSNSSGIPVNITILTTPALINSSDIITAHPNLPSAFLTTTTTTTTSPTPPLCSGGKKSKKDKKRCEKESNKSDESDESDKSNERGRGGKKHPGNTSVQCHIILCHQTFLWFLLSTRLVQLSLPTSTIQASTL
ncbi:hypothetical protein DPEC_G00274270 [Dallia pectoralis]|uniref:Uncharacterized protein n=1 Tax=Dallia pectoralis TaxID=75939 RepID=A0ACC2FL15_DALPE|nr:hypothetical protein DPEC_G00274270 [Dallia pectoralis]